MWKRERDTWPFFVFWKWFHNHFSLFFIKKKEKFLTNKPPNTHSRCCIAANARAINRKNFSTRLVFCSVLLSLSSCLLLAFPLGSNTGSQPTPLPPPDFPLRVRIFCQTRLPANKTWKPVIEKKEVGLPPSRKQPYCICSPWLRATFPRPVPVASRHLLLCLIKESAGRRLLSRQ